jgi:hypothetical protein
LLTTTGACGGVGLEVKFDGIEVRFRSRALFEDLLVRMRAAVRALLPEDWLGGAGEKFRTTVTNADDYIRENIRPAEKATELPELAWNRVECEANENTPMHR